MQNNSLRFGSSLAAVVAAAFGVAAPIAASAATGDLLNLGTLGGQFSSAADVNDLGQVVGTANFVSGDGVFTSKAFFHPGFAGGTAREIVGLGGTSTSATAINNAGRIVGQGLLADNASTRAFVTTAAPGAAPTRLPDLAGDAYAHGLNGSGVVVGEALVPSVDAFRGYVLPAGGNALVPLAPLPGGSVSTAQAINDGGDLVGASDTADDINFVAVKRPAGGASRSLGTLGGVTSFAYDVNAGGAVTGYAETVDSTLHAFYHAGGAGDAMVDLGTLGGDFSNANAINDQGIVVGNADKADGSFVAALWLDDAAHTIVDLDAWLDEANPAVGAEWTLLQATGVNNVGQVVGIGAFTGDPLAGDFIERAFVLDVSGLTNVPEPAALGAMLATTLLATSRRRRLI